MPGQTYRNRQREGEIREEPSQTHRVGEQQGKQEHLSGQEHSRQALEHHRHADQQPETPTVGHGIVAFGHAEIAARAHQLWVDRGCPEGSPDEDWFRATEELRSRSI
ncbi:MAG TPA: DUF2934 domain-containing protein [Candidatus Solibacter sp.]|jgi:hypothetical protein